mgnify:CR=1 FL=1
MHYVYGIICPIDFKIKYVGVTENVKARLSGHISAPNKLMADWMNNLKTKKIMPSIVILDIADRYEAFEKEIYWINKIESDVGGLFNDRDNNVRAQKLGFKNYCELNKNRLILTRIKNGFSKLENHPNLIIT